MPEQYKQGERVRVVVEGFVTHTTDGEELYPGELAIALETTAGLYDVTVPLGAITVERLAPDVQPREVWQDRVGGLWWSVCVLDYDTPRTMMMPQETDDAEAALVSPEDVNRQYGPITRVYPLPDADAPQPEANEPRAPRLMLGDLWRAAERGYWPDGRQVDWQVVEEDGQLGLTLGGVGFHPWDEVNRECGPLTLIERAGYRPTGGTVPAERLTIGMVVSHPDWVGGAPVRLTAPADGTERAYELLGDGETGVGTAAPAALFTVWEPARNEGAR